MTASRPDYYVLLGVSTDADPEAIRAAYRELAKQHHPDLAGDGNSRSPERFLQIQEAYDVLRDVDRRAQYDLDLAYRAALEEAQRQQRELPDNRSQRSTARGAAMRPLPPIRRPRKSSAGSRWLYGGVVLLFVLGLGTIFGHQRLLTVRQDQITVVRVDAPLPPGAQGDKTESKLPHELSALTREVEEAARLQASRTEEAKNRLEQRTRGDSERQAAAAAPSRKEPSSQDGSQKITCAGEGRSFSVVRQKDAVSVSYNGGQPVRPKIDDQGAGMVIVSMIEPTNKISIAFLKGDKDGTIVLISDAVGHVFRTFGVDCSAAAF